MESSLGSRVSQTRVSWAAPTPCGTRALDTPWTCENRRLRGLLASACRPCWVPWVTRPPSGSLGALPPLHPSPDMGTETEPTLRAAGGHRKPSTSGCDIVQAPVGAEDLWCALPCASPSEKSVPERPRVLPSAFWELQAGELVVGTGFLGSIGESPSASKGLLQTDRQPLRRAPRSCAQQPAASSGPEVLPGALRADARTGRGNRVPSSRSRLFLWPAVTPAGSARRGASSLHTRPLDPGIPAHGLLFPSRLVSRVGRGARVPSCALTAPGRKPGLSAVGTAAPTPSRSHRTPSSRCPL